MVENDWFSCFTDLCQLVSFLIYIPIYFIITHHGVRYHFRGMWFMMLMKKRQIEVENHHMRSIRYVVLALVPIFVAKKIQQPYFATSQKIHTYIYQYTLGFSLVLSTKHHTCHTITGWCFQRFYMFIPVWGRFPF